MNSLLNQTTLIQFQNQAIELMKILKLDIHLTDLPKVEFDSETKFGAYHPRRHLIKLNPNLTKEVMESTLIHELCHSLQDSSKWNAFLPYYMQHHEIEAYSVQDLYDTFKIPVFGKAFKALVLKFPRKFAEKHIEQVKNKMANDDVIRNHQQPFTFVFK